VGQFASTQRAEMRRKFALGEQADALELTAGEQAAAIAGLSSGLADGLDRIGVLAGRADASDGRLAGAETRLDGAETRLDGAETRLDGAESGLSGTGAALTALASRVSHDKSDLLAEVARLDGLLPEHPLLPATFDVVVAVDFVGSTVTKKRLSLDTRGRITAIEDTV